MTEKGYNVLLWVGGVVLIFIVIMALMFAWMSEDACSAPGGGTGTFRPPSPPRISTPTPRYSPPRVSTPRVAPRPSYTPSRPRTVIVPAPIIIDNTPSIQTRKVNNNAC